MKRLLIICVCCLLTATLSAQDYRWARDIAYTTKDDAYALERLKLDVYYPEGKTDLPVVVWFHGGGLEAGAKEIPNELRNRGYVVVGVNYRLLPRVTVDQTLDDAAEAVAGCSATPRTTAAAPARSLSRGTRQGATSR